MALSSGSEKADIGFHTKKTLTHVLLWKLYFGLKVTLLS